MRQKAVRESVLKAKYGEAETKLTSSLERARPSDLSKTPTDTKSGIVRAAARGGVRYMIMIACFLVFLGACLYLLVYAIQYFQKQEEIRFMQDFTGMTDYSMASIADKDTQNVRTLTVDQSMAGQKIGKTVVEKKEYNEYYENMRTKLNGLRRINSDVWGWITVDKTTIDYIVMKASDNEYYLYRSYTKQYNRNGSIFADYRTKSRVEDNRNLILYGHNMKTTQTMFYPLLEYATNEEAFKNRMITIATLDGVYTYEVFAVYDTRKTFNYIKTYFSSDEDFVDFLKLIEKKSIYHKDVDLNADTKILTLSTCTVRSGDDMRWAIHAYLVGVSK